jgi:hypothetical protein
MKIKFEHVTKIFNLAQIVLVSNDEGQIRVLSKKGVAFDAEKYGKEVAERYSRRYCFKVTESHKDYYVLKSIQKGTSVQVSKHTGGIVGIA